MPDPKAKPVSKPEQEPVKMVAVYLTNAPSPVVVGLLPDHDAAVQFVNRTFRWYDTEPVLMKSVLVTFTPSE